MAALPSFNAPEAAHKPLGSFAMDGFWQFNEEYKGKPSNDSRREKELKELNKELAKVEAAAKHEEKSMKERPPSAALSVGAQSLPSGKRRDRPHSALRQRPSTAPTGRKSRPPSAKVAIFEAKFHTKSAKELRKEYIALKGFGQQQYSLEQLFVGDDGDMRLTNSEASTECVDDDDGGSDSDRSDLDDADRLDRALRRGKRLQIELQASLGEVDKLVGENKQHREDIAKLNETLEEYEEQNAFLEEADLMWRGKLGDKRDEIARQNRFIDRVQMSRADLEERYLPLALRLRHFRKALKRKGLALECIADYLSRQRKLEGVGLVWQSWREHLRNMKAIRQILAERRDSDSQSIHEDQVGAMMKAAQKIRELEGDIASAHASISKLRASRVCLWSKILGDLYRGPTCQELLYVAWIGWRAVHPGMLHERQHQDLNCLHEHLQSKHASVLERLTSLDRIIADMRDAAEADADQRFVIMERQRLLQSDLEAVSHRSYLRRDMIRSMEKKHKEEVDSLQHALVYTERNLKAELAQTQEMWQRRHAEATVKFYVMKRHWKREFEDWKAQVDDLHEALKPEGASAIGRASRPPRVVSRSRGVLCAGCLTQIVHRDVQPVKSVAQLQKSELVDEKNDFLRETFGETDLNEPAYAWIWQQRKDPLNLRSFCMPVEQASVITSRPTQGILSSSLRPQSEGQGIARSQSVLHTRRPGSGKLGLREEVAGFRKSWQH